MRTVERRDKKSDAKTTRKTKAPDGGATIVLARRLSLYRNLASAVFPERASADEAKVICDKIRAAYKTVCKKITSSAGNVKGANDDGGFEEFKSGDAIWHAKMSEAERLFESDVAEEKRDNVVFLTSRNLPEVIVNASDHAEFVVDCMERGFRDATRQLSAVADELGKRLNFANAEPFGWLAADPDHAGVGMKISQCFCFAALFVLRELDAVLRGLERIGFDVAPMYSDPEEDDMQSSLAPGCCYWLSPVPNDGMDANALADKAERVFSAVTEIERNARIALFADNVSQDMLADYAMRSVGIGVGARTVSEAEFIDLKAALEFAIDMGVFKETRSKEFRHQLFAFYRTSAALFDMQERMAPPDLEDDHFDFLKKRFLADLIRQEFACVLPEWFNRNLNVEDDMENYGPPKKKRKQK